MINQKGNILAILMILILLAGLGAGVYLTQHRQIFRSKASADHVAIVFDTDKVEKKVNDSFTAGVLIKPGSAEVIGVDITLENTGQAIKGTILPESDILDYNILADDTNLHYVAVNTNKSKVTTGMLKPYGLQFTALKPGSGAIRIKKAAIVTKTGVVDPANIDSSAVLSYNITPLPVASSTPTGSITGPANGKVGDTLTFTATANAGSGTVAEGNIYVTANGTLPAGCLAEKVANTIWCNIQKRTFAGTAAATSQTYDGQWTPTQAGSYTVIVNTTNSNGQKCTGNTYNATGGWPNCGSNSKVGVTISSSPTASACSLALGPASITRGLTQAYTANAGSGVKTTEVYYNYGNLDSGSDWHKMNAAVCHGSSCQGNLDTTQIPAGKNSVWVTCNAYTSSSDDPLHDSNIPVSPSTACSGNPNWAKYATTFANCGDNSRLNVGLK